MATVDLRKKNFEKKVGESRSGIAIIDFWGPWCEPCKIFAPVYEEVSKGHKDITFAKVNTETEAEVAAHFNIRAVPTLMVIRDNIVVFSEAGAMPKAGLENVIQQVRDIDMDAVRQAIAQEQDEQVA